MRQSLQRLQKNDKFINEAFLYALAIAITVGIAGHSSLARSDRLLPILQPFPSDGVEDGLQVDEHDLVLLSHEHGLGLEGLGLGLGIQELGPRLGLQECCLGLQQPSLGNGFVSGNRPLLEIDKALGGGLFVSTPSLLPLCSGLFVLGYELFEGFLERHGVDLPGDVSLGSFLA
jgi:hypothetical protein